MARIGKQVKTKFCRIDSRLRNLQHMGNRQITEKQNPIYSRMDKFHVIVKKIRNWQIIQTVVNEKTVFDVVCDIVE